MGYCRSTWLKGLQKIKNSRPLGNTQPNIFPESNASFHAEPGGWFIIGDFEGVFSEELFRARVLVHIPAENST